MAVQEADYCHGQKAEDRQMALMRCWPLQSPHHSLSGMLLLGLANGSRGQLTGRQMAGAG